MFRILGYFSRLTLLATSISRLDGATIANGSFEAGSLGGWSTGGYADIFYPPAVRGVGERPRFANFFTTMPTDGTWVFSHVFDSNASGDPWVGQAIGMIRSGEVLAFDFRLGWDYSQGRPPTMSRSFLVRLFDSNTNELLVSSEIFDTNLDRITVLDTGSLGGSLDLSSYSGRDARVQFVLHVPELLTGPGHFQLDNVRIVPEIGTTILLSMSGAAYACRRTRWPTVTTKIQEAQQGVGQPATRSESK